MLDRELERRLSNADRAHGGAGRDEVGVCIAILKPSPSSPSRFSAGATTSWNAIADVSVERCPILSRCFSAVTPSASISTTNADSPLCPLGRSVEAEADDHDALPPFVMNIFEPLSTYSSPRRTAVVWIAETSDPAPGSEEAEAAGDRARRERRQPLLLCSSVPHPIRIR